MARLTRTLRPADADARDVRQVPRLDALRRMPPAEAAAWVDTNVTTLAKAKEVLAALAALAVRDLRREDRA